MGRKFNAAGKGSVSAIRHRAGQRVERESEEEYRRVDDIERELTELHADLKEQVESGQIDVEGGAAGLHKAIGSAHARLGRAQAAYLARDGGGVRSYHGPVAPVPRLTRWEEQAMRDAARAAEAENAELMAFAKEKTLKGNPALGVKGIPETDPTFLSRVSKYMEQERDRREGLAKAAPPPSSAPVEERVSAAAPEEPKAAWEGPTKPRYTKTFTREDEADSWRSRAPVEDAVGGGGTSSGKWGRGGGWTTGASASSSASSGGGSRWGGGGGGSRSDDWGSRTPAVAAAAAAATPATPAAAPAAAAPAAGGFPRDLDSLIKEHHCVYKKIGDNRYQVEVFGKYASDATMGKGSYAQKMMEESIATEVRAALEKSGKVSLGPGPRGSVCVITVL